VAEVIYARAALRDIDRLLDFLAPKDPAAAARAIDRILSAVSALDEHPLIGRLSEADLLELVISHGKDGYLALYEFREAEDLVVILAVKHQREQDYRQIEIARDIMRRRRAMLRRLAKE
jgi:plasmid stabilization system protein ParE